MRRKYKLTNKNYADVDLRSFEQIILNTINQTVPGKNPKVFETYFSTDVLNQSESVAIGRALAKITELSAYGKSITIFRLFDGKTYASEQATMPITKIQANTKTKPRGGRMK